MKMAHTMISSSDRQDEDGDTLVSGLGHWSWRLGHVYRPGGRVLSRPSLTCILQVSPVCGQWDIVPVQSSSVWAVDIASCLHQDSRAGCFLSSLPRDSVPQVLGWPADPVAVQSHVRVMDIPGSSTAVRLWPGFATGEVRTETHSGLCCWVDTDFDMSQWCDRLSVQGDHSPHPFIVTVKRLTVLRQLSIVHCWQGRYVPGNCKDKYTFLFLATFMLCMSVKCSERYYCVPG